MKTAVFLAIFALSQLGATETNPAPRKSSLVGTAKVPAAAEKSIDPQLKRLETVAARFQDTLRSKARLIANLPDDRSKDSAMQALESDWESVCWEPIQAVLNSKKFIQRARGLDGRTDDRLFFDATVQILSNVGLVLLPGGDDFISSGALGSRSDLLAAALTPASKEYLALRLQENINQAYYDGISTIPLDSLGLRSFGWEAFRERHPKSVLAGKAIEFSDQYLKDLIVGTPNECPFSSEGKLDTSFAHAWKRLSNHQGNGLRFRMLQDWNRVVSNSGSVWNKRTETWFKQHHFEHYCSSENASESGD